MLSSHPSPAEWKIATDLIQRALEAESFDDFAPEALDEISGLLPARLLDYSLLDGAGNITWNWVARVPFHAAETTSAPQRVVASPTQTASLSRLQTAERSDATPTWTMVAERSGNAFDQRDAELMQFFGSYLAIAASRQRAPSSFPLATLVARRFAQTDVPLAILDASGGVQDILPAARQLLTADQGGEDSASLARLETWWRMHAPRAGQDPVGVLNLDPHLHGLAIRLPDRRIALVLQPAFVSPPSLSPRERDVLAWLLMGKTNPAIAQLLGLSARTVERHCGSLFAKLGVRDRLEAVDAVNQPTTS